jgi:MYXO-CTERM domain-containing protein
MDTGPTSSAIGSPTTLVLADNLSEAAIVDALHKGRTVVQLRGPDDPFVELKIGDAEIGDEISDIANVEATVHVVGGDGTIAQLWRDGKKLDQKPVAGNDTTVTFSDEPGAQLHRYRVELINDLNQRIVVTSHIWVHGVAADGGCGCRSSSGSGWLGVGAIWLAALLTRRRRAR